MSQRVVNEQLSLALLADIASRFKKTSTVP